MTLTTKAQEYLRSLNGECIPMNFDDASIAILEVVDAGFARRKGLVIETTDEGRVLAK